MGIDGDIRTEGATLAGIRCHYEVIGATAQALAGIDQVAARLRFLEAEVLRLAAQRDVAVSRHAGLLDEIAAYAARVLELQSVLAQVTDRLDGRLSREPGDDEIIRAARELLKEE